LNFLSWRRKNEQNDRCVLVEKYVGIPGFIYIFEFKLDGAVRKCLVSDKEKGRILKIETGLLVLGI